MLVEVHPGLLGFIEDHATLATLLVAGLGGGFALLRHRADQAWQKKQFAFDYVQQIFDDPKSMSALRMLDWDSGEIPAPLATEFGLDAASTRWTAGEVAHALRVHDAPTGKADQGAFSRKEYAIRELFDACLTHLDRLGHFLRTGIIAPGDVPAAISYYPKLAAEARCKERMAALGGYIERYLYSDARHLFAGVG